jgi:hypothetical protein
MPIQSYAAPTAPSCTSQTKSVMHRGMQTGTRRSRVCLLSKRRQPLTAPMQGETTILIVNEAIWMSDKMNHTIVNPNQLRAFGLTVQDNPFSAAPTCIAAEGQEFVLPLKSKGTTLGVTTRTPTSQELQTSPHVVLSSEYEWDSTERSLSKSITHCGEEVARTIGAVRTQEECDYDDVKDVTKIQLLDVGDLSK